MFNFMFQNGNKRIGRLIMIRLAWGVVAMVLIQIQGHLPSLDFLDKDTLKLVSFALAVLLTVSKGAEMFFDKTVQMLKSHEIPTGDTETTEKT